MHVTGSEVAKLHCTGGEGMGLVVSLLIATFNKSKVCSDMGSNAHREALYVTSLHAVYSSSLDRGPP